MAYGKTELTDQRAEQMNAYQGSFSQMGGKSSRGGGSRGKDPGKRHFSNTYRPNEHYADIIRCIPDECVTHRLDDNNQPYQMTTPWMEWMEHFHAGIRDSSVCSGGVYAFRKDFANLRTDCWGCYERYKDYDTYKASGKQPPVSHSQQYAIIVLRTGVFHQGTFTNNRGSYQSWVKCPGAGCQFCGTAAPTKYGHVQAWPMYRSTFDQLLTITKHIETSCSSCGSRGGQPGAGIQHVNWYCPSCRTIVYDQSTTATPEQLAETTGKPAVCPYCQHVGFLAETIHCDCGNPVRATLYDVDLTVQLSNKNLTCLGWSDPALIDAGYADALKYKPKLMTKFAPTDLEEQAKRFRVQGQQPPAQGPVLAQGQQPVQAQAPNASAYVQDYSGQQPNQPGVQTPPQGFTPGQQQ